MLRKFSAGSQRPEWFAPEDELQKQLDETVQEYVAAVGRSEWPAAKRLSERTQQITEALHDANERAIGLNLG